MFCSIVLRTGLPSYSGGNHLSPGASSPPGSLSVQFLRESSPTIIWVSRSWGLPRSTLNVSIKTSSLWHFQSIRAIFVKNLGRFPAVSPKMDYPDLLFHQARTLRSSQIVRAWTFLYILLRCNIQRSPERYRY